MYPPEELPLANFFDFPFSELPPEAHLDDLASLVNLDQANFDTEQLGLDAIKEQQAANLRFSSDKCALIPEDRAQVMLTSVGTSTSRPNAANS